MTSKKTLDDLVNEINSQKAGQEDAPIPGAPAMPVLSTSVREQMLAELAEKFGTTPDEVAKTLMVGEPTAIAPSPDLEQKTLPKGTKLVPVLLKRDYWAHPYSVDQWPVKPSPGLPGDNRFIPGTTINLPGDEARRLIASGAGVRNDPLPDEG